MTKVAVVKADSYAEQAVEQCIEELLNELGGISEFIKPNMLEGVDKKFAVTTHP